MRTETFDSFELKTTVDVEEKRKPVFQNQIPSKSCDFFSNPKSIINKPSFLGLKREVRKFRKCSSCDAT